MSLFRVVATPFLAVLWLGLDWRVAGLCLGTLVGITDQLDGYVARKLGQITDLPPTIVAETQRRVFQRRGIAQEPWHIQLLRDMYQQVAEDRQLADRPLSL